MNRGFTKRPKSARMCQEEGTWECEGCVAAGVVDAGLEVAANVARMGVSYSRLTAATIDFPPDRCHRHLKVWEDVFAGHGGRIVESFHLSRSVSIPTRRRE